MSVIQFVFYLLYYCYRLSAVTFFPPQHDILRKIFSLDGIRSVAKVGMHAAHIIITLFCALLELVLFFYAYVCPSAL